MIQPVVLSLVGAILVVGLLRETLGIVRQREKQ